MKPFQVNKIILRAYHVLTTFTPRPCQVLTTSIRFQMRSYHALTTLTPFIVRSNYVLNTTKQTALRAYHAFSTFLLHFYYFYIEHILLQQIQTFSIECHYYLYTGENEIKNTFYLKREERRKACKGPVLTKGICRVLIFNGC